MVESAVLHARILCDILLSRTNADDDIRLTELHLPGDVDPVSDKVDKKLLDQLAADYGNRRLSGTPCWEFNKMLAHPDDGKEAQATTIRKHWEYARPDDRQDSL